MASQGGFSYKPNVNRAITKKWKEATQANYGGDDWGDDDDDSDGYGNPAPVSAGNNRHPAWGSNRSVTNPSPSRSTGRPSFDRGEERRHFSGGAGFDSAYPTTQRSPFPDPNHGPELPPPPQQRFYAQQTPLQLNTHPQAAYPQPAFRPSSRSSSRGPSNQQYQDTPFSAPGAFPQYRPPPGSQPNPGPYYQRQESPVRPDSRGSNRSAKPFPPRKSSLSQQQPPADLPPANPELYEQSQHDFTPPTDVKPLPFIRPADIYKRMAEAQEKQRLSQESSRPSVDFETPRTGSETGADPNLPAPSDDMESSQRLKPVLDTVPERKSEYGFDKMLNAAEPGHPSLAVDTDGVHRHPTNASSVYTDRQDPGSASSMSRNVSLHDIPDQHSPSSPRNLPTITRPVDQGSELTPSATNVMPHDQSRLDHQPSFGYRSVVQQAFDQSESQNPRSPISGSGSFDRSNSQSTAEISPIVSRTQDYTHGPSPILEEPNISFVRPQSDATLRSGMTESNTPAYTGFQPGFRRDQTPPSRDNSPAQRLSLERSIGPTPQHGIIHTNESGDRGREHVNSQEPLSATTTGSRSVPSQPNRSASEEYEEWQAQRSQFRSQVGMQDSNPTTPSVESVVSRSESPTKGTVKDITDKLESHSGRSTPVDQTASDRYLHGFARPPAQTRLESFRPALPGGWQSYTTSSGADTPTQEHPQGPPRPVVQTRTDSTDSVPTAKSPTSHQQNYHAGSRNAFAAASAAGSALASSLGGKPLTYDDSDDSSENEWDQSSTASPVKETAHGAGHDSSSQAAEHTKDVNTNRDSDMSRDDYFPAPLRTSKQIDPVATSRPPVPNVRSLEGSSEHGDDEELHQDIVKSLTPRSSNVESGPSQMDSAAIAHGVAPQPSSEQEDMYSANTPGSSAAAMKPNRSDHVTRDTVEADGHPRPFLEQRFSWEDENSPGGPTKDVHHTPSTPPRLISSSAQSPDTVKAPHQSPGDSTFGSPVIVQTPSTPTGNHSRTVSREDQPPQTVPKHPEFGSTATSSSPTSFRNIMNISDQQHRIKAFQSNASMYAQPNYQLNQWMLAQRGPEHEAVFRNNGHIQPAQGDRPSPGQRPPSNRPIANISGAKVMQEDGKKLMAAAGRFGGKAGFAAKGLFSKGKDKLRSASTSDKGLLANRRKSADSSQFTSPRGESPSSPSQQPPTLLSVPPQIPAQDLHSSPIGGNWSQSFEREESPYFDTEHSKRNQTDRDASITEAGSNGILIKQHSPESPDAAASETTERPRSEQRFSHQAETPPVSSTIASPSQISKTQQDAQNYDTEPHGSHSTNTTGEHNPDVVAGANLPSTRDNNLHSANQSLGVPVPQRNSMVSDVSSASPDPRIEGHDGELHRSISPADAAQKAEDPVPSYRNAHPPITKEAEAARDLAANETSEDDPVPLYEEVVQNPERQRIQPGAQIIPVADLRTQRPVTQSHPRPFSFEASELFNQQIDQQHTPGSKTPSQPLSPVSQTMSKSMSEVSSQEVVDDERPVAPKRQSKSYSRPFGTIAADPVGTHPAFRHDEQSTDRSQMYSSERPVVQAGQRPYHQPVEEEGYRIPGPYHQEYRSPKRTSVPEEEHFPVQQQHPSVVQPVMTQQPAFVQPAEYTEPEKTRSNEHSAHAITPVASREDSRQKRSIGGFFGSKGRSKTDIQEPAKKNRPGVFSRNTRQESANSQQSGQSESRDVLGQLPSAGASSRPDSPHNNRPKTPTSRDRGDGGKKRFSAMGNLFSKSRKTDKTVPPQRSTTLPSNSTQPGRDPNSQNLYHLQVTDSPQQQMFQSRFQGDPPPPGGYYNPAQQNADSAYGTGSTTEPYGQRYYSTQHEQGLDARPSDLRVDTNSSISQPSSRGGGAGNPNIGVPPQTRAARDISYQSQPYIPPTNRGSATNPPPSKYDNHVIDLHKRSRSPKLGRHSSDLDEPPISQQRGQTPDLSLSNPSAGSGTYQSHRDSRDRDRDANNLTPVGTLGTFSNKKISPVGGIPRPDEDQEAPFKLSLPGDGEEERRRRTRQLVIEQGRIRDANGVQQQPSQVQTGQQQQPQHHQQQPTVAERAMSPQFPASATTASSAAARSMHVPNPAMSPTRAPMSPSSLPPVTTTMAPSTAISSNERPSNRIDTGTNHDASTTGKTFTAAELPGSRPDGYESEEEVVMSATAGPGDWDNSMPVWVGDD